MDKYPMIINCVECGLFLGVFTENGLMIGNIIIDITLDGDENSNEISCGDCGESLWWSVYKLLGKDMILKDELEESWHD
jgi:hypothetical protein